MKVPKPTVRPGPPDLRDLVYVPSLKRLPADMPPVAALRQPDRAVRDQKAADNCTAQALAAAIDILLLDTPRSGSSSADMLFERGRDIEAATLGANAPPEGLTTLRSAIKAFYHNGVCTDEDWRTHGNKRTPEAELSIGQAARNTPLGSYYRLQPILHDYHAAIVDAGVVFAAAEIHDGWERNQVKDTGTIGVRTKFGRPPQYHAFAIVGYRREGFLILNSWGPKWGRYKDAGSGDRWPGIALWPYQDWACHLLEGWVLSLGVTAPDAFDVSQGEQGLEAFRKGAVQSGSTRRLQVLGHYIHLDDGKLSETGSYPTDANSVPATVARLNEGGATSQTSSADRPTRGVVLWLAGGNESTKDAITGTANSRQFWRDRGLYPITVLWCSDFIENAQQNLDSTFAAALKRIGSTGVDLDRQIELDARGVGRAFWRDVKRSAAVASTPAKGGWAVAFQELLKLRFDLSLHIVAEGAGALLLAETLASQNDATLRRFQSVSLVLPACTVELFTDRIARWSDATGRQIGLFVPRARTEGRLRIGSYGQSLLHLVERCFEEVIPNPHDPDHRPKRILGLSGPAQAAARADGRLRVQVLHAPPGDAPIPSTRALTFTDAALTQIRSFVEASSRET